MAIKIVIVEDDPQFRAGLGRLLEGSPSMEVVGRFARGREAIQGILEARPDVALIDLELPDISGIEVIETLARDGCPTELLVLTVYDDDRHLFAALRAGAVGYILKSESSFAEVVRAIEEVVRGGAPMSLGIARRVLDELRQGAPSKRRSELEKLTGREAEILECLAKGLPIKKVAEVLQITYQTARTHQRNIYRKLQVSSLLEAVSIFRGRRRNPP